MKKVLLILSAAGILILLAGCAAGPNTLAGTEDQAGETAGFLLGIWHGIIAPVTLAISIFSDKITMYEVHNSGLFYNLGFLVGMAITLGGGGSTAAKS